MKKLIKYIAFILFYWMLLIGSWILYQIKGDIYYSIIEIWACVMMVIYYFLADKAYKNID